MSVVTAKINPAIAKDMKNGKVLCLICNIQVKAKTWVAHSSGRKHHDNIELLKKRHLQNQNQSSGVNVRSGQTQAPSSTSLVHAKRNASEGDQLSVPVHKKRKEEPVEQHASTSFNNSVDNEESGVGETPWHSTENVTNNGVARKSASKHVIAGVPEGFFDDEKLDSRVAETMEKQAKMEEEYALFMNELKDAENEQEREEDVEEEAFSLERDVSNINEHINGWKTLNKLEIHREEVVASATQVAGSQSKTEEVSDDDNSDSESIGLICWRNKPFL